MKIPGTTKHIYFGKKDAGASATQSSAGPSNAPATTSRERTVVPGLVIWSSGKRAPARSADTSAPTRAPRATGEALAQLGARSRDAESSPAPEAHGNEPGPSTDSGRRDTASRKATAPPPEVIAKVLEVIARDETPQAAAVTLARVALANHDMEDQVKRIMVESDPDISRASSRAALERDRRPENFVAVLHRYPHVEIPATSSAYATNKILTQMAKVTAENLGTTRSIDISLPRSFLEHWSGAGIVGSGIEPKANAYGMLLLKNAMGNLSQHGSGDLKVHLDMHFGGQAAALRTRFREILGQRQSKLWSLKLQAAPIQNAQLRTQFETTISDGLHSGNNAVEHLVLHVGASEAGLQAILQAAASPDRTSSKVRSLDLLDNNPIGARAVMETLQSPHNKLEALAVELRNMDAAESDLLRRGLIHDNARHLTQLRIVLDRHTEGSEFGQAIAEALVQLRPDQPGEAAGTSSASIVNPLNEAVINGAAIGPVQAGAIFTKLAAALPNPACGLRTLALYRMSPDHASVRAIIEAAASPLCRLEVLDLRHIRTANEPSVSLALDAAKLAKPDLQILTTEPTPQT